MMDCNICVVKTKMLISCAVTVSLFLPIHVVGFLIGTVNPNCTIIHSSESLHRVIQKKRFEGSLAL